MSHQCDGPFRRGNGEKRLKEEAQGKTLILISHRSHCLIWLSVSSSSTLADHGDGPKDEIIEALRAGRIGKPYERGSYNSSAGQITSSKECLGHQTFPSRT